MPSNTRAVSRQSESTIKIGMILAACGLAMGCGPAPLEGRIVAYRIEIESALGLERVEPPPRTSPPFPARRDRRMAVGDQRIGPFDFLATMGCRLSELVAARNAPLGKVLVPSRRLAHEAAILDAIDDCLPTLATERAERLRAHAIAKRADLSTHVWNAVWLDEELERYLSSGPAALVGGSDPDDGPRQLAHAAEAIAHLDVPALEEAFQALRDDPAIGPRLTELVAVTRELDRVGGLVSDAAIELEGAPSRRCEGQVQRLARVFKTHYIKLQPAVIALDRNGQETLDSLAALYRASVLDGFVVSEAMQRFHRELLDDGSGAHIATRLRAAIVDHARAWGPILDRCGGLPGRPA